ncbi:hypothetical protein KM043_003200 [Ampulex compressa]|nr:hypothetical protein KM043_003200 [Ampulex compressa]
MSRTSREVARYFPALWASPGPISRGLRLRIPPLAQLAGAFQAGTWASLFSDRRSRVDRPEPTWPAVGTSSLLVRRREAGRIKGRGGSEGSRGPRAGRMKERNARRTSG